MSVRHDAVRQVRPGVRAVLLLAAAAAPASAGPTMNELVEVADIASLSPSPSGRTVAFRVERPSIERNSYAIDWYVADLDSGTTRRVGGGGAPIYGDAGPLEPEIALWSPDGRFLFHRALVDEAIGVWRTAADGSGGRPVVVRDADVERLAGSPDGRFLTYELGPPRKRPCARSTLASTNIPASYSRRSARTISSRDGPSS